VSKNEDQDLTKRIEDHNLRAMRGDLTQDENDRVRKLLEREEEIYTALKVHERAKWIVRSIAGLLGIIPVIWAVVQMYEWWMRGK
jgi:hypothetical protein